MTPHIMFNSVHMDNIWDWVWMFPSMTNEELRWWSYVCGIHILIDGLWDILILGHDYFRVYLCQICTYLILGHTHHIVGGCLRWCTLGHSHFSFWMMEFETFIYWRHSHFWERCVVVLFDIGHDYLAVLDHWRMDWAFDEDSDGCDFTWDLVFLTYLVNLGYLPFFYHTLIFCPDIFILVPIPLELVLYLCLIHPFHPYRWSTPFDQGRMWFILRALHLSLHISIGL